jgi:hypothetical protein
MIKQMTLQEKKDLQNKYIFFHKNGYLWNMNDNIISLIKGVHHNNVYYDLSSNRQVYEFSQDGHLQPLPGSQEYVPSFDETRLADVSNLLAQENTTFGLTLIAGVSVLVLGLMILKQQSSP